MDWKEKLRRVFSKGHGDIYEAAKKYAEERGVATTDVVASAVTSYLAADDDGKQMLEKTMAERRASGGGGGTDAMAAVEMFTKMADSMSKMFGAVNELRSSVSIGSMVSDFETVTTAIEKIKGIGSEKGKGSTEDVLADALVRGIVNKFTGGIDVPPKKVKQTGKDKVDVIEE